MNAEKGLTNHDPDPSEPAIQGGFTSARWKQRAASKLWLHYTEVFQVWSRSGYLGVCQVRKMYFPEELGKKSIIALSDF